MTILSDGTPSQSGLRSDPGDYEHENITYPVLGVVLTVYCSDDPQNQTAARAQDQRGSQCQARVLVFNDGSDSPWILPNVTITPPGSTGADNFEEQLPKGTTGTVDGSPYNASLQDTVAWKLNGDWMVVGFIGESIHQPISLSWYPHPSNRRDPTTSGQAPGPVLEQARRLVKRFQGTRWAITRTGTVFLDTTQANHFLNKDGVRTPNDVGGDVFVNIKPTRMFEMNWNPPVFLENEPDFLWGPAKERQKSTRSTDDTAVRFTKAEISLIAGELVNIVAKRGDVNIQTPEGQILFGAGASENMLLGQQWKTMMTTILNLLISHVHPTAVGPAGPSPNLAALSSEIAQLDTKLSNFIFGKADP